MSGKEQKSSLREFQILNKVGEGAFSSVFKVLRKSDGQIYALKKVKIAELKNKEKENALNEIRILASVDHPNIVGYKDAFIEENEGCLCVVMEFLAGGDLYHKIKECRKKKAFIPEKLVWRFLGQMASGLNYLHKMNILHRDLKSANVFLSEDLRCIKLGDLNVSKVVKNRLVYTQTGTPYYASPEVWRDQPYDSKSDIWSLGCVVYEMCNKGPPFNADKMEELYEKVQKGVFDPVSAMYTDELNQVVSAMLRVNPLARPTCEQILEIPSVKNQCRDLDMNDILPPQDGLLNTIKLTPNLLDLNNVLPQPKYDSSQIKARSRSVQTQRVAPNQDDNLKKGLPSRLRERPFLSKEPDILQAYKKVEHSVGGLASPIPSSRYQAIMNPGLPAREPLSHAHSRGIGPAGGIASNRPVLSPHVPVASGRSLLEKPLGLAASNPKPLAHQEGIFSARAPQPSGGGYLEVKEISKPQPPAVEPIQQYLPPSGPRSSSQQAPRAAIQLEEKKLTSAVPQPQPAGSYVQQPLSSQRNNLSRSTARGGKEEAEEGASSRRDQRMVVKQPPSYLQDLLVGGIEPRKAVGVLGVMPKTNVAAANLNARVSELRIGNNSQLRQSGSRSPPQNMSESRLLNKSQARKDSSVNESLNQAGPQKPKDPNSPGIFVLNRLNIGNAALHSRFQSKLDKYADRQRSGDQSRVKDNSHALIGDSRLQLSPKAKDSSVSYKNRLLGPQEQSQNGSLLRGSLKRQNEELALQRSSVQTGPGSELPPKARPTDPGSMLHPSILAAIHMPTEPVARVKGVQLYEEELAKKVEDEIVKRQRKRVLLNAQSAHERYDVDGSLNSAAVVSSKLLSENLSSYRSAQEQYKPRLETENPRVLSSATKEGSTVLAAQANALASVKAATLKKHPKVISPMIGHRLGIVNLSQRAEEETTIKRSGIQRFVPGPPSSNGGGQSKLSLANHLVPSLDRHPIGMQPQRIGSAFHLNKKISEGNIRSPIVNNFLAKPSLAAEMGVPFPKYSNRQISERDAEELEKVNKKIDQMHMKRLQGEKSTPQMAVGIVAHHKKKPLSSASKVK